MPSGTDKCLADGLHGNLGIGCLGETVDEMILEKYQRNGEEPDERHQRAESHAASLHALHESAQGLLVHQLDGKNIDHGNATGVNRYLRSSEECVVEQEIDSSNTKQHKQQERSSSHDSLRRDT